MIKQRVLQLIDYKGVKKEEFFNKIGMSSANFRGKAKETPLNSTAIENIFSVFPNLNIEWLITGNGEMFKPQALSDPNNSIEAKVRNQERQIDQLYRVLEILATKLDVSKESLYKLAGKL